ncbi:MAG TPA: M48 family metallopeptidase [Phycisphaerales bacterium]|nr:M48 family metallopeptidase [Phycisphaerales bacterium]
MTHLLVIAILATGALRGLVDEPLAGAGWVRQHPALALLASLLPFAGLLLLHGAVSWACVRRLDRRGDPRALARHERAAALVRASAAPAHAFAVLAVGWLDLVRGWCGDLVALDELVAAAPALGLLMASWAMTEPVERRVREALIFRRLDEGLSIPPMPGAWGWWWGVVRQQLLFAAAPVVVVLAWSELVGMARDGLWERSLAANGWPAAPPAWTGVAPEWLLDRDVLGYGSAALQLAGVVAILAMLPVALRYLWDTAPLGPGALRDRLLGLCSRYGVRVRGILVWRTHGAMINGAVVGFLPRLRYIILTDALLESLPADQVEAVAAHEIAHVRHHHIPWLAGAMLASALCIGSGLSLVARAAGLGPVTQGWTPVALLVAAFGVGLLVFGWASRRFEWQADAFAAGHMSASGFSGEGLSAGPAVSEHGAASMAGALRAVAMINGFPPDRFTWRHGSISDRLRRLNRGVGLPLDRLPETRSARAAKLVIGAGLLAGLAITAFETAASSAFGA